MHHSQVDENCLSQYSKFWSFKRTNNQCLIFFHCFVMTSIYEVKHHIDKGRAVPDAIAHKARGAIRAFLSVESFFRQTTRIYPFFWLSTYCASYMKSGHINYATLRAWYFFITCHEGLWPRPMHRRHNLSRERFFAGKSREVWPFKWLQGALVRLESSGCRRHRKLGCLFCFPKRVFLSISVY